MIHQCLDRICHGNRFTPFFVAQNDDRYHGVLRIEKVKRDVRPDPGNGKCASTQTQPVNTT